MPAITYRPARDDDYDFLFALHSAAMRDVIEIVWGWNDEFQVQFFREHHRPERLRIIELDGKAVGVIGFDVDADRFCVGPIEVDPAFQGRGIGSAALAEMFQMADAAGVPATLQVLKVNRSAFRLYSRVGFEIFDETETHHLMRRRAAGI